MAFFDEKKKNILLLASFGNWKTPRYGDKERDPDNKSIFGRASFWHIVSKIIGPGQALKFFTRGQTAKEEKKIIKTSKIGLDEEFRFQKFDVKLYFDHSW